MNYTYKPKNTCSQEFIADIENRQIKDFKIIGWCSGNTQAICKLIKGQEIKKIISILDGIDCRNRGTSCPDQIAQFLKTIK